MVTGPSASKHPARIGRVAFFAPEMRISPSSGIPPWICSLSTRGSAGVARVLVRRIHLQGERMDLVAHQGSEGLVHELMALHGAQSCEFLRDHHGLEMHVVLARD